MYQQLSYTAGLRKGAGIMKGPPTRVISITSGKGGVGKTHTTVNLGVALVREGKKVLLLDADLGLANIDVMLGFRPKATLQQVFRGEATLDEIVISHESGFDIIPASSGVPEMTLLSAGERFALMNGVEQLGAQYDYMIIDTAAGIGSNVMHFNAAAEDVLVVVDQEPTSITDAYALIKVLATHHGRKEFHVLVNRTPFGGDGRRTYGKLAAATGKFLNVRLNYLGGVTEDTAVTEAVMKQRPFLELFPSARSSLDISRIARKIIDSQATRKQPQGGMQLFFQELLECGDAG